MVPSELSDWLVRFGAALIAAIGIVDGLFGFLDIGGKDKTSNRTNNVSPNAPLFDVSVQSQSEKLIGRDESLRELVDLLCSSQYPALALIGMAGVGKTTLAAKLVYGQEMTDHFKDGVLWASLGQNPDVMGVLAKWAKELGEGDISTAKTVGERQQIVRNALNYRHVLLVIID